MGSVGGVVNGFGIKWMNCGALMNQFFGNKKTMLSVPVKSFAVKIPLFAVVNIAVLCLLTVLFPICLDISLITPAC
jgi:hypothetical protein